MRYDLIAREMRPSNANDAWWEGFQASLRMGGSYVRALV